MSFHRLQDYKQPIHHTALVFEVLMYEMQVMQADHNQQQVMKNPKYVSVCFFCLLKLNLYKLCTVRGMLYYKFLHLIHTK